MRRRAVESSSAVVYLRTSDSQTARASGTYVYPVTACIVEVQIAVVSVATIFAHYEARFNSVRTFLCGKQSRSGDTGYIDELTATIHDLAVSD